jgi:hypothetical protein
MNCEHCQGVMRDTQFCDCEGTQGFIWMKGWWCTKCRYVADPLITATRRLQEATGVLSPSEEPEKEHEPGCLLAKTVAQVAV